MLAGICDDPIVIFSSQNPYITQGWVVRALALILVDVTVGIRPGYDP
jgi:hypothetical protein